MFSMNIAFSAYIFNYLESWNLLLYACVVLGSENPGQVPSGRKDLSGSGYPPFVVSKFIHT